MLSFISCKSYRCLEDVHIPLDPLTVLVGPNGAGKSAVLRAIDILCGLRWPSIASLNLPQDFTSFDTTRTMEICVGLKEPIVYEDARSLEHRISQLQLLCKPYKRRSGKNVAGDMNFDFTPLDVAGRQIMIAKNASGRPQWTPLLSVSTGQRDEVRTLFVDHRRTLLQHLPTVRGSVLARLFEPVRREWQKVTDNDTMGPTAFAKKYDAAMTALRTPELQTVEDVVSETAKRMLGFLGGATLKNVHVSFGFADPANPFSSLRVEYREGSMRIPGEQLGLGTQSAIVIGIFEALRQLDGTIGTLLIEEPELALHPQARRYFHRVLTELADREGCQVIYSTHSSTFADATRFESVRLIRRPPEQLTRTYSVNKPADILYLQTRRQELATIKELDVARSELLFAERVLLVEGSGDMFAAREVADKLELDLDGEGLSVIDCGGKNGIPFFARFCEALGIEYAVMHDEDIYPDDDEYAKDNKQHQQRNEEIRAAMRTSSRQRFILQPTLEEALGIGRNAKNKPRRVLEVVRNRSIEDLPDQLLSAVKELAGIPPF